MSERATYNTLPQYLQAKQFLIDNLGFRLGIENPEVDIAMGTGNPHADIVVIQPHRKFPERDAITGALKRFNMLDRAFRTTSKILDLPDWKVNRATLIELVELIRPIVVIACGAEVTSILLKKEIRQFSRYTGRKIRVDDLTNVHVCATLDPMEYGFARAPEALKQQGKTEWEHISRFYAQEKKQQEDLRWPR